MATPRSPAMPQDDEELLQLLYRGGELLSGGNPGEARPILERALSLQPKNEKAQNLLGLAYFKLGILDRAGFVYEQLVRDNPTDPTLRVNLGLVYLKQQDLKKAIHEFEAGTDLAPDHAKAHNYLGLALAQLGDYARAREHFLLAGSDAMAEKMARAVAGEVAAATPPPAAPPASIAPPPPAPERVQIEVVSEEHARVPNGGIEEISVEGAVPPSEDDNWGDAVVGGESEDELRFAEDEGPSAMPMPEEGSEPQAPAEPEQPTIELGEELVSQEPPPLTREWPTQVFGMVPADEMPPSRGKGDTRSRRESFALDDAPPVAPPTPALSAEPQTQPGDTPPNEETFSFPPSAPSPTSPHTGPNLATHLREVAPSLYADAPRLGGGFLVGPELAILPVQGELCARLGDLIASVGALEVKPAYRRVRGKVTQEVLGGETAPFSRISGVGRIWLWAKGRGCVATKLSEESLYIREERLVAFEDSVSYENGRIPNAGGAELPLVHLAGRGRVLLAVDGSLRSVEVLGDVPLSIALESWVGWYGKLTPRVVAPANGHGRSVELTGEGVVLLRLPQTE